MKLTKAEFRARVAALHELGYGWRLAAQGEERYAEACRDPKVDHAFYRMDYEAHLQTARTCHDVADKALQESKLLFEGFVLVPCTDRLCRGGWAGCPSCGGKGKVKTKFTLAEDTQ